MLYGFLIFIPIATFLLSFWAWSIYVVLRQKKAWRFFADKRKLRYHERGFLETPSLSGVIEEYGFSFFSSEHEELDGRTQRALSAIELTMHTSLPTACAVASGGMVKVVERIGINHEYKPPQKGWDDSYVIRAQDLGIVREYFDEERLGKLISLMQVKKAWVIFMFINGKGILRLDTPLPIDNPKEMDILVKQMIAVAKVLELKDGEEKKLVRKRSESDHVQPVLEVDDDLLKDHLGFELEEDED